MYSFSRQSHSKDTTRELQQILRAHPRGRQQTGELPVILFYSEKYTSRYCPSLHFCKRGDLAFENVAKEFDGRLVARHPFAQSCARLGQHSYRTD